MVRLVYRFQGITFKSKKWKESEKRKKYGGEVIAMALPRKVASFENPELLGSTTDISWRYHWFLLEMTSEERAQKFHTDEVQLPITG